MREFKVIVEDKTMRYAVLYTENGEDKALSLLTNASVKKVVEHLLFPDVGKHHYKADDLCLICNTTRS